MVEQLDEEDGLQVCTVCGSVPVVSSRPLSPRLRGLGDGIDGMFLWLCSAHASEPDYSSPQSLRAARAASRAPTNPWWQK
jgi:hypothetical protein